MKTRIGFVSNSSSSSFIVAVKSKESQEALTKHNNKILKDNYGNIEDYDNCYPYVAEPSQKILTISSVEQGTEEGIETLIFDLLKSVGFSAKDITVTLDD